MVQEANITLIILVAIVAGIPILGFTSRMAIRTIVEAFLDLRDSFSERGVSDGIELRLARMEEEIRALSRSSKAEREGGHSGAR